MINNLANFVACLNTALQSSTASFLHFQNLDQSVHNLSLCNRVFPCLLHFVHHSTDQSCYPLVLFVGDFDFTWLVDRDFLVNMALALFFVAFLLSFERLEELKLKWLYWTYEEVISIVFPEILNDRLTFLIDYLLVLVELKIVLDDVDVRCL